jgi:hypothetical protein
MKYGIIKGYKAEQFRQVTGVMPDTFNAMVRVLRMTDEARQKRGGRKRKLNIEETLLVMLEYYKEYRTFECIAASYGVSKQSIHKMVKWVEERLIKSGLFSLPGKKALNNRGYGIEVIVVDTTETPIQRPQKRQEQ